MFPKNLPLDKNNHNFLHSGNQGITNVGKDVFSDTINHAITEVREETTFGQCPKERRFFMSSLSVISQDWWMDNWEGVCCAGAMFIILSIITGLEWSGRVLTIG